MKKLAIISVSLLGVLLLASVVACGKPQPTITTAYLPDGEVNIAYFQTLQASGGSGTYTTWSITSGTLPDGLSLDSSTGVISGTPTAANEYYFTVQVTDSNSSTATEDLAINIDAAPSITTTSLPDGAVNTAYSQTIEISGGSGVYTWSITTGTLPVGLTLDPNAGTISGTPTTAGSSQFTVQATDSNSVTTTQALSINIDAASTTSTSS